MDPSQVERMTVPEIRRFVQARESDVSWGACEYGHLDCSTELGGPCYDEAMTVLASLGGGESE